MVARFGGDADHEASEVTATIRWDPAAADRPGADPPDGTADRPDDETTGRRTPGLPASAPARTAPLGLLALGLLGLTLLARHHAPATREDPRP